uniref:Protein TsetseEP domain-containing protein n=1 Tax=Graphocephala atropunctata TaxID=36148 RepID=A0A1B6KEH3_9HEMI
MAALTHVILVLVGFLACVFGQISVEDIQFQMNAWNQYLYERPMEIEQKTCELAINVTQNLVTTFARDLDTMLTTTHQTFRLVNSVVKARGATACIRELQEHLRNISVAESEGFHSCVTPVIHGQTQLKTDFTAVYNKYLEAFKTTLADLDMCKSKFPNERDVGKMLQCVQINTDRYYKEVVKIRDEHLKKPCMKYFVDHVISCVEKSLDNVVEETLQLLSSLVHCAKVGNAVINSDVIASIKSSESHIILRPTINTQIAEAQNLYDELNKTADKNFREFIEILVDAKIHILYEEPEGKHAGLVKEAMIPYFTTIDQSLSENKDHKDTTCGNTALQRVKEHVQWGAQEFEQCYKTSAADITIELNDIADSHRFLAGKINDLGNVAILECLNAGYIFGTKTIKTCFDMKLGYFQAFEAPKHDQFVEKMRRIKNVKMGFYDNATALLPCAEKFLKQTKQKADNELYVYQKCMYKHSGTDYSVIDLLNSKSTGPPVTRSSRSSSISIKRSN